MTYAANTVVPVEKTRAEIERLIVSKGAGQFMSGMDSELGRAIVGWTMNGRMVRLRIVLPDPKEERFAHRRNSYGGFSWRTYPADKQRALWEQACALDPAAIARGEKNVVPQSSPTPPQPGTAWRERVRAEAFEEFQETLASVHGDKCDDEECMICSMINCPQWRAAALPP